jgi:hypothetical protein
LNQVAKDFVSWMLTQRPLGFEPTLVSEREVKILTDTARAEVTLWPDFNDGDICEMRIERIEDAEQVFFLHFMLDDLKRASTADAKSAAYKRLADTWAADVPSVPQMPMPRSTVMPQRW